MNKFITMTSILAILAACEPRNIDANDPNNANLYDTTYEEGKNPSDITAVPGLNSADGSIANNPNSITLSDYTQDQQKIDRERYAAEIDAIAAQREEITSVTVPEVGTVNPAKYARSSTNAVGVGIFTRNGKRGNCRRYSSSYEAQRAFLRAGGPTNDTLGLDPDGDGFACKFDPTSYRSF